MTELLGVLVGAFIAIIGVKISTNHYLNKMDQRDLIKDKMKEIDVLILLNKKINEILQKRDIEFNQSTNLTDYEKIANFDDVTISVEDYVYLQSFCSLNHYYLPTFMVEEFFNNIAHRKIVLDAESFQANGTYVYQGAREVLEQFSDQIIQTMNDRKVELKQLKSKLYK